MSDGVLDSMYEARCAADWEAQNEEKQMDVGMAINFLTFALDSSLEASGYLGQAMEVAEGFPVKYRIESIFDELETLQDEIRGIKGDLEREEARK